MTPSCDFNPAMENLRGGGLERIEKTPPSGKPAGKDAEILTPITELIGQIYKR